MSYNYAQGDVILVEIPFSGAVGSKRRPAVVISVEAFNQAGTKLVVAAITSNLQPPFRLGDTILSDWASAGLVKPSAVRGVIATVDKSDVTRVLGKLSPNDWATVSHGIAQLLGF